jgi:ADP-ribose pyrophosphatase
MTTDKENASFLRFTDKDATLHQVNTKFKGFFKLDEYQVSHKLFNGGKSDVLAREVFDRGDAVVLIPYDPIEDTVLLLEQYRPGAIRDGESPWLLEFIAGMFGENESPEHVAIREAEEEAGLQLKFNDLIHVMQYFSSPGGMTERISLYAVKADLSDISGVHGLPEEGEDILVHVLSRHEAMNLLAQGKITNAATIIGLQWLALNYSQLAL